MQTKRQQVQGQISIHALRGEGDHHYLRSLYKKYISIHALRGEGDHDDSRDIPSYQQFQSTPSVGRATEINLSQNRGSKISIHALRGEGDQSGLKELTKFF